MSRVPPYRPCARLIKCVREALRARIRILASVADEVRHSWFFVGYRSSRCSNRLGEVNQFWAERAYQLSFGLLVPAKVIWLSGSRPSSRVGAEVEVTPEIVIVRGGHCRLCSGHGARACRESVVVLEREVDHIDQVRGEFLALWGVAEAAHLGLLAH
jgi:hypothetical protein